MMKKIIALLLALMLCAAFATTAYAATAEEFVIDDANILTDAEETALEAQLSSLSHTYEAQLMVYTVESIGNAGAGDFVKSSYKTMGVGYGSAKDGVMLMVSMESRDYQIHSHGFAEKAIGTGDIAAIGDVIVPDLSEGNYADAFALFADECAYYLNGYTNGYPFAFGKNLLIALAVGLVIALIVTGIWKGQLKSVRRQKQADVYVKAGSLEITQSGDYYMYRTVTRTQRQQNKSSGRGGSGSTGGGKF